MAAARRPQPPATPAARYRAQARALREQAEALRRDRDAEMARIGKGCKLAVGRARGQLAAVATEQRRVLEQLRARLADRRRAACPPAQRKARDAEVKQLEQQIAEAQVDQRDAVVEGALAVTDPTLIPVWREVAEHVDATATPETAIKILEAYVAEQPGEVAKAIEAAGEEVAREIEALAEAAEKGEEVPTSSAGAGLLERLQAALPQGDTIELREKISLPRGWWANLVRSGVTERSAAGSTKEQAIEALAERLIQQPTHGWSGLDFENVRRVIEKAPAPPPPPAAPPSKARKAPAKVTRGERYPVSDTLAHVFEVYILDGLGFESELMDDEKYLLKGRAVVEAGWDRKAGVIVVGTDEAAADLSDALTWASNSIDGELEEGKIDKESAAIGRRSMRAIDTLQDKLRPRVRAFRKTKEAPPEPEAPPSVVVPEAPPPAAAPPAPPPRPLGPQPTVSLLEVEPPRPAGQWGETGALFGNVEPAPTLPVLAFLGIPPRFQADFAEGLRRAGDEANLMLGILPAPVGSDAASYYEPADVLDDDGSSMMVSEHTAELGRREELAAERGIVLLQASAPMVDLSEVGTLEAEAYDWENGDVGTPPPSLYAVLSSDVWHSPQHFNSDAFWRGKLIAERLIGAKLVREASERGIFFAQGDTFKQPIPEEVSSETAGLSRGQGDALAMAEVAPYRVDLSSVLAELAKAQKDREEEARREKEEEEGEASQPAQVSRMDQLSESWDEWAAPIGKSLIPIGTERFTYQMSPARPSELATYYAAPYKRRVTGSLDRNTFLAWGDSGPTIVLAQAGKARLVQWPGQGGMGIVFDGDSLEAISVGKLMQGLLLLHRCREELDRLADHPSHRQILASLLSGTKGQILRDSQTRPFAKIAAVKEAGSSGQRVYELETSAKVIHQIDRGKVSEWSSVRGSGEREEESADHWQLHGERSILATAKVIRRPSIVPGWRYFVRVQCALLPYELQPLLSQGLDHWATYDLDLPNVTVPKIDDRSQRGLQNWDYVFEADPTGETEWIPPLPSELGPVVEVLLKYLFPFVMMERVADEAGGSAAVFLSVARFSDALHEGLRPYRDRVETRKAQVSNLKDEARRGDAWALPYHRPSGAVGRDHAVETTVGEVRKEANFTWTIPVTIEGIERTWQIGYNNIPEADRERVLQALLMVLRDYPSRKRITSTGGVDWSPATMTDVLNDVAGYLNEQNAEAGPLKIVYVATGSDDKRIGSFYTKNVVATAPNLKKVALSLSVGNRSGQYDVDHLPNGLLVRSFSLAKPAAIGAFHELVQRLGAVAEQDGLDLGFADRAAGRLREAIGRLPESFQVFTDLENRYGKLAEEEKARKAQLKASATTDAIAVIDRAREEDKIDRSKVGTELTRFKEYGKRGALVASAWVVNIGGSLFLNGHVQIGQREAMFLLGIEGAGGAVDGAVRSILENWIRDTNLLDDEASKAMDQALDKGDLTELLGTLVVAYLSKYAKPQIAYGAGREPVNLRELEDAIKSGAVKWAPREETTSFPRAFPLFAEWRGSMFAVTRFKEFSQSLSKASVTALPAGLSVPLDELTEAQKVTVAQALDRVMPWEEPRPLMINFAEKFRDVLKGLNLWPISGATQQKALLDWAKGARGGKRRTPNPSGSASDQIARCREARAELAALAADGAAVARRLAEVRRGEIVNQRVAACEAPREEVRRRYDPQIEKLRREAHALEQKARAWESQEKGRKRGKLPPLDASEQDALIESVLLGLAPELVSYWAEMAGQTKGAGAVERFDAFLAAMGAGAALLPPSAETAEVWAAEGQGERFAVYLTEGLSPEASTLVRLLLAAPDYAAPEHALRRSFSRYYPDPALWWSTVHDLAARSLASHPWALEQTGEDGGTLRLVFSPEAAPPEEEPEAPPPPPPPPPEAAPLSLEPVNEASEAPAVEVATRHYPNEPRAVFYVQPPLEEGDLANKIYRHNAIVRARLIDLNSDEIQDIADFWSRISKLSEARKQKIRNVPIGTWAESSEVDKLRRLGLDVSKPLGQAIPERLQQLHLTPQEAGALYASGGSTVRDKQGNPVSLRSYLSTMRNVGQAQLYVIPGAVEQGSETPAPFVPPVVPSKALAQRVFSVDLLGPRAAADGLAARAQTHTDFMIAAKEYDRLADLADRIPDAQQATRFRERAAELRYQGRSAPEAVNDAGQEPPLSPDDPAMKIGDLKAGVSVEQARRIVGNEEAIVALDTMVNREPMLMVDRHGIVKTIRERMDDEQIEARGLVALGLNLDVPFYQAVEQRLIELGIPPEDASKYRMDRGVRRGDWRMAYPFWIRHLRAWLADKARLAPPSAASFVPPPAAPSPVASRWDAPMGEVPLTPQAEALGVKVTMDDLPYEIAKRAHQHTSHVPEERGRMRQREYMRAIEAMAAKVAPLATSPEKKERLRVWLEEYRAGYLQRLQAWLNAESNTASTMITGGSGFNVERNRKRMATADNRRKELQDFENTQLSRIKRELGELSTTIRADDPNAIESLRAQLKQLDHLQAKKAEIKAILKNKNLDDTGRARQIEALGFSAGDARLLARSAGWGLGYQTIRSKRERIEGRIMQLSREQARPRVEVEAQLKGAGGRLWPVRVVDDPGENRIRLHFAERIDAGTAALLKKHGFKWAPSQTAWQRQRTDNARSALKWHFGIDLGRASSPSSTPAAGSDLKDPADRTENPSILERLRGWWARVTAPASAGAAAPRAAGSFKLAPPSKATRGELESWTEPSPYDPRTEEHKQAEARFARRIVEDGTPLAFVVKASGGPTLEGSYFVTGPTGGLLSLWEGTHDRRLGAYRNRGEVEQDLALKIGESERWIKAYIDRHYRRTANPSHTSSQTLDRGPGFKLWREHDKVKFSGPYVHGFTREATEIGGRWNSTDRFWFFEPQHEGAVKALVRRFYRSENPDCGCIHENPGSAAAAAALFALPLIPP